MQLLGITGWSGSGKTTLLTALIPLLAARGRGVSTVKHAHHDFDLDQPGKDSWRHRAAGAHEVMIATSRRWALLHENPGEEPDLAELLARLAPVDLVLIEGFKASPHPKIEVHRPSLGKPPIWPGRPDIVAVLEVDDDWAAALEGLAEQFPHQLIRPRPDNFGIAVLSRWPLVDPQVVAFSETGFPSIIATVRRESGDFRFIATHPYPPFNGRATEALLVHLAGVAEVVESSPVPCIVAGDLNATPWSRPFRELLARSGLVDTAVGHGVQPTWHAHLPAPRIPIDHVLVPPAAVVLRREVGPDIGSDHFPVEAELILPAAPASPRPRER